MVDLALANETRVLMAGDWHGQTGAALTALDVAADTGCRVVVQLGDHGLCWDGGSNGPFTRKVCRRAAQLGLVVIAVNGNHEHWSRLLTLPKDQVTRLRIVDEHVLVAHEPTELVIGDRRWLFLPGAISVDRNWRLPGHDWFGHEEAIDDQLADQLSLPGRNISVVAAHDAPDGFPALEAGFNPHIWPADAIVDSNTYRRRLRRIADARMLPNAAWWHGHHHRRVSGWLDGDEGTVRVECLSTDDAPLAQRTALVDNHGQPTTA